MKHGHCGEACIKPTQFRAFKIFESNLTIADGSTGYSSCADLGWPKYSETVTHGDPLKILTVTLDLFNHDDEVEPDITPRHARGFVRTSMNANVAVATFTDDELANVPNKLDWSQQGGITAIKDQGSCGSCWAFSAVSGVESGLFMATGSLPAPLSTQQVISCDKADGGCDGGDIESAFHYLQKEGGLDTEAHYPDKSHNSGQSKSCKSHNHAVKVTDYKYAVKGCSGGSCKNQDENGLKAALHKHGPLSICVNAEDWDSYSHGVFTTKCSGSYNKLDHCVQLVGYDTTASTPYWKVRNSWSKSWGEHGHIRLPMGENACGIADEAMFVTAALVSEDAVV